MPVKYKTCKLHFHLKTNNHFLLFKKWQSQHLPKTLNCIHGKNNETDVLCVGLVFEAVIGTLLETPTSHVPGLKSSSALDSRFLVMPALGDNSNGSSMWFPATLMGDLD